MTELLPIEQGIVAWKNANPEIVVFIVIVMVVLAFVVAFFAMRNERKISQARERKARAARRAQIKAYNRENYPSAYLN